jgi:ADP-glucose pyrophosphorylase
VLVLLLAGGAGGRLELLTEQRATSAVPYAGTYRLVDVPLTQARVGGDGDVALVGCRTRVDDGAVVPPGARVPDPG